MKDGPAARSRAVLIEAEAGSFGPPYDEPFRGGFSADRFYRDECFDHRLRGKPVMIGPAVSRISHFALR